jgi:hypothetical protein
MKKINIRQCFLLVASICAFFLLTPAYAVASADTVMIVDAVDRLRTEVVAQMTAASNQLNRLLTDAFTSPSFPLTPNAQVPNLALLNPAGSYTFEKNPDEEGGKNVTGVTPYALVGAAIKNSAMQKLQYSVSNENPIAQKTALLIGMSDTKKALDLLDAQNFLRTLAYTETAQNNAERAVAFVSDYASPFGTIDLKALQGKEDLYNSDAGKAYRVKVYGNVVMRSLFLGNLYDSFNTRVPIKGLAEKSGMSASKGASASLAEVEEYAASRRIKNPEWYKAMNTAPSIAVQREIAFMLAEMQWQLHQLHQDNEKMLQTMTVMGLTNLRMTAGMSSDQKEMDLKQAVEGTTVKQPEPADLENSLRQ